MSFFSRIRRGDRQDRDRAADHIEHSALQPGAMAPDFSLSGTSEGPLALRDFRGRPVILAFYPADHSSVCSNQLALYNEALPLFHEYDAELLAVSVDDPESHDRFANDLGLRFPLLADHTPKGAVAREYGVFNEQRDQTRRALFVIDAEGVVRWSEVVPAAVNPGAHGILAALKELAA